MAKRSTLCLELLLNALSIQTVFIKTKNYLPPFLDSVDWFFFSHSDTTTLFCWEPTDGLIMRYGRAGWIDILLTSKMLWLICGLRQLCVQNLTDSLMHNGLQKSLVQIDQSIECKKNKTKERKKKRRCGSIAFHSTESQNTSIMVSNLEPASVQ